MDVPTRSVIELKGCTKNLELLGDVDTWRRLSAAGDGPQIFDVKVLKVTPRGPGADAELAIVHALENPMEGLGGGGLIIAGIVAGGAFLFFGAKELGKEVGSGIGKMLLPAIGFVIGREVGGGRIGAGLIGALVAVVVPKLGDFDLSGAFRPTRVPTLEPRKELVGTV